MDDPYLPRLAQVKTVQEEVPGVVTLGVELSQDRDELFDYQQGQFNMLSLPGVGEVAISIMGLDGASILHTIRAVGRVSEQLVRLRPGDHLGLRGPYGNGWPLRQARGGDLVFITAGLGCAPVVGAISKAVAEQSLYRRIVIIQGVKYHNDLLWEPQYQAWRDVPNVQVLLAASEEKRPRKSWTLGMVTVLLDKAVFDRQNCIVMMCGPEVMMRASMHKLLELGVDGSQCYLSLERNMQCGLGHCGHCQMGSEILCRFGPVYDYPKISHWLETRGV